jgi:hypothetical protein
MRFFRPHPLCIALFALFVVIALFGWRESAAFTDGVHADGTAFWPLWMALLAPLALLLLLLDKAGLRIDLFHAPSAVFWAVQIVYLYTIACAISSLIRAVMRKITSRRD